MAAWIEYQCKKKDCRKVSLLRVRPIEDQKLPVLRKCPYCPGQAKIVDIEGAILRGRIPASTTTETNP